MLTFLLDEHFRGPLWLAIQRHNARGGLRIDAVRVGDPPDLPLGSDDGTILAWAARHSRILITEDVHSMPGHLGRHLQGGAESPGVFLLRGGRRLAEVVDLLELVAHAGEADSYRNQVAFVP